MSNPEHDAARRVRTGERIADRYVAKELLGAGGMGQVERVFDERTGREVALKLLGVTEADDANRDREIMFEREYQTLAELAHPRIIEVFDYGICEHGRYYTMELLDGSELLDVVPLDWRQVCSVLRDVASALALLHSRRLLHRDITARNVHLRPDGRAKLLDFGALTAMGTARSLVGTPPHVAPEAFHGQPLDPRADLFALGALAYLTLTGRHAYPAQMLSQLRDAWRSVVAEPSRVAPHVPEELDRLVLSLLALDRLARPGSASEVIERLTAIAGLQTDETPAAAAAYVTSPTLVAREPELTRFRQSLLRAVRGRGSATAMSGPPGAGRSRLLASYRLDARIVGVPVIHAQCGGATPYATVRQLIAALIENKPEISEHPHLSASGLLAPLAPGTASLAEFSATEGEEIAVAVSELVHAVSSRAGVLISIDDLHLCDHESAVVLVRLAQTSEHERMRFVATFDSLQSTGTIVDVVTQHMSTEELQPLTVAQTHALLGSVFGDVPHLHGATEWVYTVSTGCPGVIMQLAQHLVDHGVARYESGGWSLPRDFSHQELPSSLEETWAARVDLLSEQARTLATSLALCLENHPVSEAQYGRLLRAEPRDGRDDTLERLAAHAAFTELISRDILRRDMGTVQLAHRQLRSLLRERLDPVKRAQLHRRLAETFRDTPSMHPLVVAHHHYEAGEEDVCLEIALVFLRTSGDSQDDVHRDFALEAQCLERALRTAKKRGCPRSVTTPMLVNLMGLAHRHDRRLQRYFDEAVAQASIDVGLHRRSEVLAELGADATPATVIAECMRRQQDAREDEPAEHRGLAPEEAADALARCAHRMGAVCLETLDADAVAPLPELIEPLACHSPALGGIQELAYIIRNHIFGLPHEHWRVDFVRRWREPVEGLSEGARKGTVRICSAYDGWFRAEMGAPDALDHADELLELPAYETLGYDVRFGAFLYRGDADAANEARERRNVTLAQRRGSLRGHCAASVYHEVRAYSLSGDLMALKRALAPVEQLARSFHFWKPIERWSQAEYRRLRGEHEWALTELERAQEEAPAGRHRVWHYIVASRIEVLVELERVDEARLLADRALRTGEAEGVSPFNLMWVRASAALAHAASGSAIAVELVDEALEQLRAEQGGGLPLARLLEIRVRVAHLLGDEAMLVETLEELRELAGSLANRALTARYQSLAREVADKETWAFDDNTRVARRIASVSEQDAPLTALEILLEDVGSTKGLLFVVRGESFHCAASRGVEPSAEMEVAVTQFMQAEICGARDVTVTMGDLAAAHDAERDGRAHYIDPSGEAFAFLPLRFVRDGALWISGVFVTPVAAGKLVYGSVELAVASELSRCSTIDSVLAAG